MKLHHGKIILFGEYTVINNGHAMAMPLMSIRGSLKIRINHDPASNSSIRRYFEYLKETPLPHGVGLDLQRLEEDIRKGLYLDTNAREGYGVGSSGILTTALFTRYYHPKKQLSLHQLKEVLSTMESYFHDRSSGLDPLIAFINYPLRVSPDSISIVENLPMDIIARFWLLDTGISRKTQSLVRWYKNRCQETDFMEAMEEYSAAIPSIIDDFLLGDRKSFEERLRELSAFQLKWWKKLVPEHLVGLWKEGLKSGEYYTKICGAGGGGYILLYQKQKLPDTAAVLIPVT